MKIKFNRLQWIVHIGSLIPFLILIFDGLTNNLTVNPIQEITQRTGRTAILWLMFSLACTPLNIIFGLKAFNQVRRPLGLYAAFYAALHLLTFLILDYWLDFQLIFRSLREKPFIIVGTLAFLILLALTITSTTRSIKRLGKKWKKLHQLVYAAGVLVIIHYIWVLKADITQPIIYSVVLAFLLIVRVKPVRQWLVSKQPPWGKSLNKFLMGGKPKRKTAVSVKTSQV
ncbi:MAG: sulfoxide reductase heme-binding subunit YedZ [Anaerolineaceae bacterium]|nr:sulfoxide reductase heme-binding subunit YedZ [Anaerolineaceae bacterium]